MSPAIRRLIAPTLAMLPALALLVTLGTWQLQRKAEKEALIVTVEARTRGEAAPVPGPERWGALDLAALDWQKVRVEGRMRPWPEFHVYGIATDPRSRVTTPGWWVHGAMELTGGGIVIVNRGFVPVDRKELASRPETIPPETPITIEGLLRRTEARGMFTNADNPLRNEFFTRDAAVFARAGGLSNVAPFTVEQITPNPAGLPWAGLTRVTFPNRHLEYAVTWYGLALTLVGVWGAFVFTRLRRS